MQQFTNLAPLLAYETAWQFLLGQLTSAHQFGGKGLTREQVAQMAVAMARFAGAMDPRMRQQMQEVVDLVQPPRPAPPVHPEAWPVAGVQQTKELLAQQLPLVLNAAESGRMLKQALRRRWPGKRFSIRTNAYQVARLIYKYEPTMDYTELYNLAYQFVGKESDGLDGQMARYHIKALDNAPGVVLVQHGFGHIRLTPTNYRDWDVDPKTGVQMPTKRHFD